MYLDVLSTQEDYHNKWYTYLLTAYQSAVEGLGAEGHRKVVSEFSLVSFVFLIAPRWRRREEVKKRKEKMVDAQKGKTVRQFR